jgi:hypothetical protein
MMNAEQKKFILEELIPFILRDKGLGFDMNVWAKPYDVCAVNPWHGYLKPDREAPQCGTVACIGGSICILKKVIANEHSEYSDSIQKCSDAIGLTEVQTERLLHDWGNWPQPYRDQYFKTNDPYSQALTAVELFKAVVETEGKVLDGEIEL